MVIQLTHLSVAVAFPAEAATVVITQTLCSAVFEGLHVATRRNTTSICCHLALDHGKRVLTWTYIDKRYRC